MTSMTHAPLTGELLREDFYEKLNKLLEEEDSEVKVYKASAYISGTTIDNASITYELLLCGREWSPILFTTPLQGSKANESCDKHFVDLLFGKPGVIAKAYMRKWSQKYHFAWPDATLKESLNAPSTEHPAQQCLFA